MAVSILLPYPKWGMGAPRKLLALGTLGPKAHLGPRPVWAQGSFGPRAHLGLGMIWAQGPFGPRARLGAGPVWPYCPFWLRARLGQILFGPWTGSGPLAQGPCIRAYGLFGRWVDLGWAHLAQPQWSVLVEPKPIGHEPICPAHLAWAPLAWLIH